MIGPPGGGGCGGFDPPGPAGFVGSSLKPDLYPA